MVSERNRVSSLHGLSETDAVVVRNLVKVCRASKFAYIEPHKQLHETQNRKDLSFANDQVHNIVYLQ